MSDHCGGGCSSCGETCSSRQEEQSLLIEQNSKSNIKKIIGVVSGKGGVGKSLVTSLLASEMKKRGYTAGILDADVTGPSIPKYFGITEKARGDEEGLLIPSEAENGVKIISTNMLLEHEDDPVLWRGPVITNLIQQFYNQAAWGEVDFLFVDMPPGTGDVPLTIFQSLPIDGIVIATSPSDLVSMIVRKAIKMADMMNIPIIGVVENMSYLKCPNCDEKISVFGKSKISQIAQEENIDTFGQIPIDPKISEATDAGRIFDIEILEIADVLNAVESLHE